MKSVSLWLSILFLLRVQVESRAKAAAGFDDEYEADDASPAVAPASSADASSAAASDNALAPSDGVAAQVAAASSASDTIAASSVSLADPGTLQEVAADSSAPNSADASSASSADSTAAAAVASPLDVDIKDSLALKRSTDDNSIAVDSDKKEDVKRDPASSGAGSAAAVVSAAPVAVVAETGAKRDERNTAPVSPPVVPAPDSGKNKRIIFGTSMTANRSRRKFPLVFCDLEKDHGLTCPGIKRGHYMDQYFYDPLTNRCHHFAYNGCGGNANRFSSLWECNSSCAKKTVAIGKI